MNHTLPMVLWTGTAPGVMRLCIAMFNFATRNSAVSPLSSRHFAPHNVLVRVFRNAFCQDERQCYVVSYCGMNFGHHSILMCEHFSRWEKLADCRTGTLYRSTGIGKLAIDFWKLVLLTLGTLESRILPVLPGKYILFSLSIIVLVFPYQPHA